MTDRMVIALTSTVAQPWSSPDCCPAALSYFGFAFDGDADRVL